MLDQGVINAYRFSVCHNLISPYPFGHIQMTGFVNSPIPSHATVIISPGFRNLGGLNPNPTPTGVPVAIISPGNKVIVAVKVSIKVGISKIKLEMGDFCLTSPLIVVEM